MRVMPGVLVAKEDASDLAVTRHAALALRFEGYDWVRMGAIRACPGTCCRNIRGGSPSARRCPSNLYGVHVFCVLTLRPSRLSTGGGGNV